MMYMTRFTKTPIMACSRFEMRAVERSLLKVCVNRHRQFQVSWQTGRWDMRRALDVLTWMLVIAAVSGVFYLSKAPDVEASLGVRRRRGQCVSTDSESDVPRAAPG